MTSWRKEFLNNPNLKAFVDHIMTKSSRTQDSYLCELKYICDFFEWRYCEFNPKWVTQENYDIFIREKLKSLKRSTINLKTKIISILSSLYELNLETKLLKESDKFTDYITFKELQEIINKTDKEVAAVSAFMFCTGLRPVSVVSINKNQLMLNAEFPYIKNVKMKGGKRIDVVVLYPEIVLPLLKWYMQYKTNRIKGYEENDKVFVSQKNKSDTAYIYNLIRKATEVLGRSVSPRMLRKGLGVHLKEEGYQDEVRKRIMGHSDVRTTIEAYSNYGTKDIFIEHERRRNIPQAGTYQINQVPVQNNQIFDPTLQKEKETCPYCHGVVEREMMLCPHCWKEIKRICTNCKRYINAEWEKCAYCGSKVKKETLMKGKFLTD